jgi:hypothetical protein
VCAAADFVLFSACVVGYDIEDIAFSSEEKERHNIRSQANPTLGMGGKKTWDGWKKWM